MTTALLILDAQVNMFDESPVLGGEATCRAGNALGYAVTLVAGAHSTFDGEQEGAAEIIERVNGELSSLIAIVPLKELIFP